METTHFEGIPGLIKFQLVRHYDSRGWFKENANSKQMINSGLPEYFFKTGFLQNNVSKSKYGVLRGLHSQGYDKLVSVAQGKVQGVWVDLRPGDTFGNVVTFEMDEDVSVFVPKGVANSMLALEDDTIFNYLVNGEWSIEKDEWNLNAFDEDLSIEWLIPEKEIIRSEKDKRNKSLKEIKENYDKSLA